MKELIKHLKKLISSGFTQGEIAEKVGTSQATVSRTLKGNECSYPIGKAIEKVRPKKTHCE